jgi:hypothetical protein
MRTCQISRQNSLVEKRFKISLMRNRSRPTTTAEPSRLLEWVRVLMWPCLVLLLLALFWTPIRAAADLLPSMLDRSDEISIGGVKLKVRDSLRSKASPTVRAALAGLSTQATAFVLLHDLGESTTTSYTGARSEADRNAVDELIAANLCRSIPPPEPKYDFTFICGRNYSAVRGFLVDFVVGTFLEELRAVERRDAVK